MGLKAATGKGKACGIIKPWLKGNVPSIVSILVQPST
jgi:hypothetical protein